MSGEFYRVNVAAFDNALISCANKLGETIMHDNRLDFGKNDGKAIVELNR